MDLRIRLAEQRGLLRGDKLSRVQEEALKLRIMQDMKGQAEQRMESIKIALLTANPTSASVLFPDVFPTTEMTEKEIDSALSADGPVMFDSVTDAERNDFLATLSRIGALNTDDLSDINLDLSGPEV